MKGKFPMAIRRCISVLTLTAASCLAEECDLLATFEGASADATASQIRLVPDARQVLPAGAPAACAALKSAPRLVKVTEPVLQKTVKSLTEGDKLLVRIDVQTPAGAAPVYTLVNASYRTLASPTNGLVRAAVMTGACLLLIGFAALFSKGMPLRLLMVGKDGRYSNSQIQTVLWFGTLIVAYATALYFRWTEMQIIGGISIPQNLLLLSGASMFTFATAKAITESKIASGDPKQPTTTPNLLNDVTKDDTGNFDFGDFQMLTLVTIAVVTYIVQIHHALETLEYSVRYSLPDVDSTILAACGLGQGAYLVKKAVSSNTPAPGAPPVAAPIAVAPAPVTAPAAPLAPVNPPRI
jgi:hypothetical protein